MGDLLYEGWMILAALLPSAGLLYLFYVVMKHVVEGDRRERAALRAAEQAQDAQERERGTARAPQDDPDTHPEQRR
ncbi:hypothetical protein BJF80_15385 [Serinicoccus sp. CUA-874]|uniref:hypothetical protein n=1 Tax=Serinicoccus sp. CUA-874 TaxID=1517939 RepID=UPI000959BD30|nr:hypothetical protein [Serinicoccus sp. CUA-874]OLT18384.1 hypothetical protein BJF80_15385 [Serinicoccus sp. CUA-874]